MELDGLYKRLELLNKYIEECEIEYKNVKDVLDSNIKKCFQIKQKIEELIIERSNILKLKDNEEQLRENKKKYLQAIEKDLTLDIETINLKGKENFIYDKIAMLKEEAIQTIHRIVELSDLDCLDNSNLLEEKISSLKALNELSNITSIMIKEKLENRKLILDKIQKK